MYQKILVPIDGSELSKEAISQAIGLAQTLNATLLFLHAKHVHYPFYYGVGALFDSQAFTLYHDKITSLGQSFLNEAISEAEKKGVRSEKYFVENVEPYKAIIECATLQHCDLIIMASHGYSEVEGLLLGSQTNKVLVHSGIPVLVCKQ